MSEPSPAPELPKTSVTVEDYLERIQELIKTKGYARVVDIAAGLGISQASVTNMVQRLDAEGLLKYEKYRGSILTETGEEVALKIAHRHRLLEGFLGLLGIDEESVQRDIEGMEHHISPQTFQAIEQLTRFLEKHPEVLAKAGLPLKRR